jgi:DNA invertase Pin-like site-specific DNA recombinase
MLKSFPGASTRRGVALAKARGAYKGRKKVLSEEKIEALRKRVEDNAETKAQIARDFGISRETLYQYLRSGELLSVIEPERTP